MDHFISGPRRSTFHLFLSVGVPFSVFVVFFVLVSCIGLRCVTVIS